MRIRVSSPGNNLRESDMDTIERDLQKVARRLREFDARQEVLAEVRVRGNDDSVNRVVTVELAYGRNRLIARAENGDMHQAIREARDDLLRQINDRSRRGHSSFTKGR